MAKSNKGRKFFATTATAALVASAIVPVASAAQINDFNSISSYAQEAVQDLNDRGVIKGDQKGNFNPKSAITRAEAATILAGALELEGSGSTSFTDVKKSAWYYDAIDAAVANGIFQGQGAGKFNPSANLTRSEAAIILVDAFGLEGSADLKEFKDSASVKSWAEEALSIAVANGVMKGDDNGNLKPNASITRQDFALMYYRTEGVEGTEEVSGSVKAINNTTVEVTFEDKVTDLASLDFAIEGLTIEGKVVKQTDAKTVVLTTTAQTAGVDYTVTVNGEAVGKFVGLAEVIPTKVTTTTTSLQGVIGEQVTVKAQVTVAEGQSKAGIPVTFNIVNNQNTNEKIEAQALTNDEGVASYTYTRYYSSEDNVTAYATKKSTVYDSAKVYWANKIQLAVEETTTGNELANDTKKTYKVKGESNATYYIAIKENLNINPDKITRVMVQDHSSVTNPFVTPYELTTGTNKFATVVTNSKGEGTFTIYGSDLSATPIVYKPESTPTTPASNTYNKLDLQAAAPTVKFSQVNALKLDVKAEGNADSAKYAQTPVKYDGNSVGGRAYTVTVTDKDGKIAPAGTVAYVTFKSAGMSSAASDSVYFSTAKSDFTKVSAGQVFSVVVGKEGKAQFRVAGNGPTVFATPTVFLNTAGDLSPAKLDEKDIQITAETTYFKDAIVANAILTVKDGVGANARVITSIAANKDAYFEYQSVDQNGFPYRPSRVSVPGGSITVFEPVYAADGVTVLYYQQRIITNPNQIVNNFALAFDVTSTFGNAVVKNTDGTLLNASQHLGSTKTYILNSDNDGKAVIRVTSTTPGDVSVNVTGSGHILPTTTAKVTFTSGVAPVGVSGKAFKLNKTEKTFAVLTAQKETGFYEYDKAELKYNGTSISEADFEAYLAAGATVTVTETADGVKTFNIIALNTPVLSADLTLDVAVDYLVAEASSNGDANLVIDNAALLSVIPGFTPVNGNVTVYTASKIAIKFANDITISGDLTVNAPNADVLNDATVTGDVNIVDVSSNSFVNEGTIGGNVVITDTTGARFVNNGGTVTGNVIIDTTGAVKLEGPTAYNLVIKQAANITLATGFAPTSIQTEGNGAQAKVDGNVLSSLVAVSGITTTSDSIEITFNESVAGANIDIALNGVSGTVAAGSASTKLVAKFAAALTTNDTVTVTIDTPASGSKPASKSTFKFKPTNGTVWTRQN